MRQVLTQQIIGAAIEVHRAMGPGLLESIYEECLAHEFSLRRMKFLRQLSVPVEYKGRKVSADLRIDLWVENQVIVEIKSVERLLPIHDAPAAHVSPFERDAGGAVDQLQRSRPEGWREAIGASFLIPLRSLRLCG